MQVCDLLKNNFLFFNNLHVTTVPRGTVFKSHYILKKKHYIQRRFYKELSLKVI